MYLCIYKGKLRQENIAIIYRGIFRWFIRCCSDRTTYNYLDVKIDNYWKGCSEFCPVYLLYCISIETVKQTWFFRFFSVENYSRGKYVFRSLRSWNYLKFRNSFNKTKRGLNLMFWAESHLISAENLNFFISLSHVSIYNIFKCSLYLNKCKIVPTLRWSKHIYSYTVVCNVHVYTVLMNIILWDMK